MPLDAHAKRFLDMLALKGAPANPSSATIEERRTAFRNLMGFSGGLPAIGRVEERNVMGPEGPIAVRVYMPAEAESEPVPGLVYFHGGGLVAGSLDTHESLSRTLANEIGCRLVSVDYRLAPENKFPTGLLDGEAAMTWVFEQAHELRIDPGRLGIGGDSAGATIAAILCQMAREANGPPIAFQLLICPITDFVADTESRRAFETPLLDRATMARDIAWSLPAGHDPIDPRVSPLRAIDFRGLPPAFIHTGEYDPLRDEGKAYAEALEAGGVPVRYTCHAGMVHLFYGLAGVIPQARTALRMIGSELAAALS
jgi:acetyl esterase